MGGVVMRNFNSPEEVIEIWLRESYEKVYDATSKEFQKMVTLEQFIDISVSFNNGVKNYQLETKTIIQNSTQYVWLDDKRSDMLTI